MSRLNFDSQDKHTYVSGKPSTLRAIVGTVPEGVNMHIGCIDGTSFFFVGTREEYYGCIEELDKVILQEYRLKDEMEASRPRRFALTVERIEQNLDVLADPQWVAKIPEARAFQAIDGCIKQLEAIRKQYSKYREVCCGAVNSHKNLDEFTTVDNFAAYPWYERTQKDGVIILCEGDLNGRFWDKEEFDQRKTSFMR